MWSYDEDHWGSFKHWSALWPLLCYASLIMFHFVLKSKQRKSPGLTLSFSLAGSAAGWETVTVRGIQQQCVVASWHTTSTVNLCRPSSRLRMHKDASAKKACQRPELPLAVCVFKMGNVPELQPPDWWQRAKAWHRMQQLLNIYSVFSFHLSNC